MMGFMYIVAPSVTFCSRKLKASVSCIASTKSEMIVNSRKIDADEQRMYLNVPLLQ